MLIQQNESYCTTEVIEEAIANTLANLTQLAHATEIFDDAEIGSVTSTVLASFVGLNLTLSSEIQIVRSTLGALLKDDAMVASFIGKSITVELAKLKPGIDLTNTISSLDESILAFYQTLSPAKDNNVQDIFFGLYLLLTTPTIFVTSAMLDARKGLE